MAWSFRADLLQFKNRGPMIRLLRNSVILPAVMLSLACAPRGLSRVSPAVPDQFWSSLTELCGKAYTGRLVQSVPRDTAFEGKSLVMHVRGCTGTEIRIPFHIGSNRSRTWVITRTGTGLRLKHDHRHADGSEDRITQYGGDTRHPGVPGVQEFHADSLTASLIPAAITNIWTLEIRRGKMFAYALRRSGTERRFRVEFDLTRSVPLPPAPWGDSLGGGRD